MTFSGKCCIISLMKKRYSEQQIEKARRKEKVLQAWLGGRKLSELMEESDVRLSRAQWWALKKKYEKEGFWGLIDNRQGGKPWKVTGDVEEHIKESLDSAPESTIPELKESVRRRFGFDLSSPWIGRVVKKVGERLHVGRPPTGRRDYAKGIPVDHAGAYFLKGADSDVEGAKTITAEIVKGRERDIAQTSALERLRGTKPETIMKKVETLLYLPMFGMQKPYHLLKYHKRGLGLLAGSGRTYRYHTADIFLCDIEKLQIANKIGDALAKCYIEALCIAVELEDGSYFYIDGHSKHVWSSRNIPKAFFTTLKRAERGLHQYFIHSTKGNPLILLTCPGDTRLPGVMLNLIDAFENAVGKNIIKAAVFDREGLSISIFEEFDRKKKYFITLLRSDMYKGTESFRILKEFKPLKEEGDKVTEWVAEAEYDLKDKAKKSKRTVRTALVKKPVNDRIKLIPIITNLSRKEEPDIARIARRYFARWPNQENIFRDAMGAIKVDTNHGYRKEEVPNRVVMRKKEELETNLRGVEKKLNKAGFEREKAEESLGKLKELYRSRRKEDEKEMNGLYAKLELPVSSEERQKHLSRLKQLTKSLGAASGKYAETVARMEADLKNKERHEKSLMTQKEKIEKELGSLELEKPLYEIKTEKDHLMSNLKMLLINLSSYAQRQYFPEEMHSFTMESMMKAFYHQDGYVKSRKRKLEVMLQSYDDAQLQEAAEYACMKFNNSDLRTAQGQRILMRVEGENVKFQS